MKIERFSLANDIDAAIGLAQHAWHDYYDGLSDDYIRRIAECIVRHNLTDEDLAFKISDGGVTKGLIFGTRHGKVNDLSAWVTQQTKGMTPQERQLLERINSYMDEADRNTIAQMGGCDVKLSLFISSQRGCGKELLAAITREFRANGARRMFLWTDTSCDHDYYPGHGFTLAAQYRDTHYSTDELDYMTYIYWKPIE